MANENEDDNMAEMGGIDISALMGDAPTNTNTARTEEPPAKAEAKPEGSQEQSGKTVPTSDENAEGEGSGKTTQPPKDGKAQGEEGKQPKQATPQEPPKGEDSVAKLQKVVDEQAAQIRALTAAVSQPRATPAEAAPKKEEPKGPKYQLGVPDAIIEGFTSDDPKVAKTALEHLVSGLANRIWEDLTVELGNLRKEIPQIAANTSRTLNTTEAIQQDYYGKYPSHRPLAPIVTQVATQLASEFATAGKLRGWNEEFREEVAKRINTLIASAGGTPAAAQPAGQQPPAGQSPPAAKPAPKKPSFATGHGTGASNGQDKSGFLSSIGL